MGNTGRLSGKRPVKALEFFLLAFGVLALFLAVTKVGNAGEEGLTVNTTDNVGLWGRSIYPLEVYPEGSYGYSIHTGDEFMVEMPEPKDLAITDEHTVTVFTLKADNRTIVTEWPVIIQQDGKNTTITFKVPGE